MASRDFIITLPATLRSLLKTCAACYLMWDCLIEQTPGGFSRVRFSVQFTAFAHKENEGEL
jgi:hypothetical protein